MNSLFKLAQRAFVKLPSVGHRSAQRFVFHLLEHKQDTADLIHALQRIQDEMHPCETCGLISEQVPCRICSSPTRDKSIICVVKTAHDAFRIERTGGFTGLYHVLGGLISPFEDIDVQDLKLASLCTRVHNKSVELFLAFEESIEGEATSRLIQETLAGEKDVRFSRFAVGIPLGAGLEHIDSETLRLSLSQRATMKQVSQDHEVEDVAEAETSL